MDALNIQPFSPSSEILQRYLKEEGFGGKPSIDVYDQWISSISNVISSRSIKIKNDSEAKVYFLGVKLLPQMIGENQRLTPQYAREENLTYGLDVQANVVVMDGDKELARHDGVDLGTIPLMLKSKFCVLHGKSDKQLAKLGEDPQDPGGYFIVSGVEKVVLLQEQLVLNRMLLMKMSSKKPPEVRMTCNSSSGTSLAIVTLGGKKPKKIIKMRINSLRNKDIAKAKESDNGKKKLTKKYRSINVFRVFNILRSDITINQIICTILKFVDPKNYSKITLELSSTWLDYSIQPDTPDYMKNHYKIENVQECIEMIAKVDIFTHLNEITGRPGESEEDLHKRILDYKINLLAAMIARMLEYMAGLRELDDRDSWSFKRLQSAGPLMDQLLKQAWRKIVTDSSRKFGKSDYQSIVNHIAISISRQNLTGYFRDSFVGTLWGVPNSGGKLKNNITQDLARDSILATYSHLATIDVSVSRKDRQISIRGVQNSQLGYVCPVFTPEGDNVGLLKNITVGASLTLEFNDIDIIEKLTGYYTDISERKPAGRQDILTVNGKILGFCHGPEIRSLIIDQRRSNLINQYTTVVLEEGWLYIDISPSRMTRPLCIVNEETQMLVMDEKNLRDKTIKEMVEKGAIEYLSPYEQEFIKLAMYPTDISDRLRKIKEAQDEYDEALKTNDKENIEISKLILEELKASRPYTHCELNPQAILSVSANLIPWPDRNQAPRNTYQVSMGKQAQGYNHPNNRNRFDKVKNLANSVNPMVDTDVYHLTGLDRNGMGENISVAFMAYPYTEEDAFCVREGFLQNAGFRMVKHIIYKTTVMNDEVLTKPKTSERDKNVYSKIGNNGLPYLGVHIEAGECVIGKTKTSNGKVTNLSLVLKVGDHGVVERVRITNKNSERKTVLVKLRITRQPKAGDKFAPRNAQKGTIGIVIPDSEMPFNDQGISPDFIVNPSSMPSRMTLEYLMEMISSKYGAYAGTRINGSAFAPFNFQEYRDKLIENDRDEYGYEFLTSVTTGRPIPTPINMGPVYFQALKHQVDDKIQYRGTGRVKPDTRQPPKGRGFRGGLRFGEMERDCAISHGASSFVQERLLKVSDEYTVVCCVKCGYFAFYDSVKKQYECQICRDPNAQFGRVNIPFSYKLLMQYLATFGANMHFDLSLPEDYTKRIFEERSQEYEEFMDDEEIERANGKLGVDKEVEYEDIFDE